MDNHLMRDIWTGLAAISGAIAALSFKKWQSMSNAERALGIFVGASFAWFVAPIFVERFVGTGPNAIRIASGFTWVAAAASNVLIPLVIEKARKWFGLDGDDK